MSSPEESERRALRIVAASIGAVGISMFVLFTVFPPPPAAEAKAMVIGSVLHDGTLRCVVEFDDGRRFVVLWHTCVEDYGAILTVTTMTGGAEFNGQFVKVAQNE